MATNRRRLNGSAAFDSRCRAELGRRVARARLQFELLEPRHLLAAELGAPHDTTQATQSQSTQSQSLAPITWFETFTHVERVPLASLASVDRLLPAGVAGPIPPATGEWIVQLRDDAARSVRRLAQADALLDDLNNDFTIISGLGTRGALLVRGAGASRLDIETSLRGNPHVQSFQLNQLIQGQSTTPNESDFAAGLLPGLTKINATAAWDESIGSMSIVVGVIDSGIDSTHQDLFLNIWLNQGELPTKYLDDDGDKLVDLDGDGLITFYDLNNLKRTAEGIVVASTGVLATQEQLTTATPFASGPNAPFVRDMPDKNGNRNGRIDAQDLLADANWADGRDTDNNGFFDDFFGVNFRDGAGDPFASNNPSDPLGHGTHVSGTIGAIGGNDTGVVGVNWQTSLMSLRILDNNNEGDSGAAIRAVNYARAMREQYRLDASGRVTQGANVRVLNNSWGQPGGYEVSLEAAIRDSSDAGILFVAAAGNGNFLGQGVDNDRTPFYPASYDVAGVIAVAASDITDRPASFSNFGATSVDLFAPGVGIRSTLPGGGYGSANGTSMAAPYVSGTAALVWSAFPEATVDEVRQAIRSTVTPVVSANSPVSTAGRLDSNAALNADVFAPAARLVAKQNITTAGETSVEFRVEYTHRSGIDTTSLGNDDLIVTRQWGPAEQQVASLKPNSLTTTATTATATYVVTAPGGTWDALDFGDYVISTVAGKVTTLVGNQTTEARNIGLFNVRINDPSVLYANTFNDSLEPGSLRSQIIAANAVSPAARTIILESGKYTIDIPAVVDPDSIFGTSLASLGIANPDGWTNETSGDFDIQGNITIIGDLNDDTVIDAQGLDRVFKIHKDASLLLSRLTVAGGTSPVTQGGGGILSIGNLSIDQIILKKNSALSIDSSLPIFGGAIASWNGDNSINESWITENRSDFGGAVYLGGTATAAVHRSTMDGNWGGGIYSDSSGYATVENSTFSGNVGGYGAIANGIRNGFLTANDASETASLSADGRYVTFASDSSSLVPGDSNRATDIFVYDRLTMRIERVSVNDAGEQGNNSSFSPKISADGRYVTYSSLASNLVAGDQFEVDIFVYDRTTKQVTSFINNNAPEQVNISGGTPSISDDGRYVAFISNSRNLVPDDTNQREDIFVYDRATMSIERVSVNINGTQANGVSYSPTISGDGRYVAYVSSASNLGGGAIHDDVYVFDRLTKLVDIASVSDTGVVGNGFSSEPSLSGDGRYVTFSSTANNLTAGDTNNTKDIFVYDRTTRLIERVSVSDAGVQGNGHSDMPSLSLDGRYVTFSSSANNLVPDDTNNAKDIFVYDRTTKLIERVSVGAAGVQGNGDSETPSISADGRYVTYESMASNLVPGDTNGTSDIFVYDRTTGLTESTTYRQLGSVIDVSHSTITFASGSTVNSAVYGDVKVNNSLFASNQVVSDFFTRYPVDFSSNNIFSDVPHSGLISPLQRLEQHPPVHFLRAGNPAIDAAPSESVGSRDQLDQIRIVPDIGAVEAITGIVSGKVYVDSNRDGVLNPGEPGLPGVFVTVAGPVDYVVTSGGDNPQTLSVNESGDVVVTDLPAGNYQFATQPTPGWSLFRASLELIRNQSVQGNGNSEAPSLSADGRYMSFQSLATNLVLGDTNGVSDIFVYDHATKVIERVSISAAGVQGNSTSDSPSISADGRYVTFRSTASNLVPEDTNGVADVFVYDRLTKLIERVSVSDAGAQSDGESDTPVISGDGRYVTFASWAGNLVPGDTNGTSDIFVFDRTTKRIERVSVTDAGVQGNGVSITPSISADGRYVTFVSFSINLVSGDTNSAYDVFVYDRNSKLIERVSVSVSGEQGNSQSFNPSLSADGRYVTFRSEASNLIPDDTNSARDIFVYDRITRLIERVSASDNGGRGSAFNGTPSLSSDGRFVTFRSSAPDLVADDTNSKGDVFVYDRTTQVVARVSISADGAQGNDHSDSSSVSADGRYITFLSFANNLEPADNNNAADVFIVPNPLAPPGLPLSLVAGQVYTELNLGLIPNPGTITGRVFEDTVMNGVYDVGEPAISNAIVFLDLDGDGLLDAGERFVKTAADGSYQFLNTDSYRSYSMVVQVPIGYEQISPGASDQFAWNIFLPAGSTVTERDFAIRRLQATGQSSVSVVSGRLYEDRNGNNEFDAGDVPIGGREVYLDASNFGVRDTNEPVEVTDAEGRYSFSGLSARSVAVTTAIDETLVHVNPLGSRFTLEKQPLFADVKPFGNPQAIASGDFNGDGFLDIAVALGEANKLSIRLNDAKGGFLSEEIDIDLGATGAGPTSLVVGQFDDDTKLDVALTANFTGNVTILRNFNVATKAFASTAYVKVGDEPLDIAAGDFTGDGNADLVVVNKANNTVQLLTNTDGVFTAGPAVPTGGKNSSSIVIGDFTGDASLDVAVVHASPLTTANPFGGVTVLQGNGAGGLTLATGYYTVGATPTDAAVGDFNNDGRPDIAVSNFATNSISILLGQTDGTLRVQTAILGTASGAFDLTVGDIDNDGDMDVIASNLRDRNISIFRNIGVVGGEVQFEPLENIGLGQFSLAQRMPLVVGNFDNDTSGPGGSGTIDIVTIPQRTDTLHVLKNTLVNGAHRVALTGLNTISGRDFIIKPAILPPSFNVIGNPLAIFEDAVQQSISVTGIVKGRTTGPQLQFTAISSNPELVASPTVTYSGGTTATVQYTPIADVSGISTITVRAVDAGADAVFGGEDDGVFERAFTVSVLAVNDPPVFSLLAEASAKQTDGATSIANFVTGLGNGGGADENSQTRDPLVVTATDSSFFSIQPAISSAGTLTFTPNPNQSGSVPVTVTLKDSGGRTNGGVDTTTKTFLVNIVPVNDPPSFTLVANPNRSVVQTDGPQTTNNFVTSFLPGGGADEVTQTVSDYIVTVDVPGIFAVLPHISIGGTLTFTPAIDRTGIATVSIQVRDSGGRANGGNDLSAVTSFTITVTGAPDTTRPAPVISYDGAALTNQSMFDVKVDFKEPIAADTFTLSDFTVSKGTTSNLRDLGNGKFTIAYTGDGQGEVAFGVAANVATDLAGNPNLAATSVTRTIDTVGLTPTLSTTTAALSNVSSLVVMITFGEPAIGFTLDDIVVLNGTASNLDTVNAATGSYTTTITPTADAAVTVLLPAGVATDLAGNTNSASNSLLRMVDRVKPQPTLSASFASVTNQSTFDVTVDFNEAVVGFELTDFVVNGATLSNLRWVADGRYLITASAAHGPVSLGLPAAAVTDMAGNTSLAATPLARSVDLIPVSPTLSATVANLSNVSDFEVVIDFAEPVSGFALADVTVLGGSAASLVATDTSSGKYKVTVAPSGDGIVTVLLPSNSVTDAAGNGNTPAVPLVRTIDRVAPTPVLTTPEPARTNKTTFDVVAEFGEAVTGLLQGDLVVTGGTASEPRLLVPGRYAFTIFSTTTEVQIQLPAGAVIDAAGNSNGASNTIDVVIDTSRVLPELATSAAALSNVDSFIVSIDFAKPVVGLSAANLFLLGGTLSEFTVVDESTGKYSIRVTPAADGTVTLLLPANAAIDGVGSGNLAAAPLVRTIDRVAPVLMLSSDQSSPTLETTFHVIVQSAKAITGLTAGSFDVSGGSISEPIALGDGRYSVPVTATGGLFQLSIPSGAVLDAAGNGNAASNVLSIEVTPRSSVLAPKQPNEAIDLSTLSDHALTGMQTIDLRGFGSNSLTLDSAKLISFFTDSAAIIYTDPGDTVAFAGQWTFDAVLLVDGQIHRVFSQSGATVQVQGPYDFSNPINRFDVDASGDVAALDALHILNAIRAKLLTDSTGGFLPLTEETVALYRFLDVDQNNQLAPIDALLILIEISRSNRGLPSGEAEQPPIAPQVFNQSNEDEPPAEQVEIRLSTDSDNRLRWSEDNKAVETQTHIPVRTGRSPAQANDAEVLADEAFADPLLLEGGAPALVFKF